MPVNVNSRLVRRNGANFVLLDDSDLGGGFRAVADVAARDAIPSSMLKLGMLVYTQTGATTYRLTQITPTITWAVDSGGGLPAFSGSDGAGVVEDGNPTPTASFRRFTQDDIDPAFAISSFSPTFGTTKELGDTIVNPGFTASYNAAVVSATLDETITPGPISLFTPFAAFAYGTPPLPARTYSRTGINQTVVWTLAATKPPVRNATVTAAWRSRRFFGLAATPGSYDEAFVEGLASSELSAGFSGSFVFGSGGGTQRIYLCWPTAFGNPASIKDQGGFTFPMTKVATAVPGTNAFGVTWASFGGYDVWESGITVVPFTLTVA